MKPLIVFQSDFTYKEGAVASVYGVIKSVDRQLEIIGPRRIVCLGRIAAMTWIRPDFRITKEHGQWFEDARGRRVMALFHPAALLRDPRKLPDTFEDLKRLEAEIAASCPKTWAVMQRNKAAEQSG